MNTSLQKNVQRLILVVSLFVVYLFASNMVFAARRRPERAQSKETITKFLSSVQLGEPVYGFDHHGDGLVDMYVYPLITSEPDLTTKYVTLKEAADKKQVILKENLGNRSANKKDPPSSYSIVAQLMGYRSGYGSAYGYGGSRYGYGSRYGSGYGAGYGYGSSAYYPRGGTLGGGWQSRGFMRGGTLGYYGYGSTGYQGYPGSTGIRGWGLNDHALQTSKFAKVVALAELDSKDAGVRPPQYIDGTETREKSDFELNTLCFEKWRLIEESRRMGEPEYFSYVGLASPFIRKQLVLFPNQTNAHMAIEKELRNLGVESKTKALADVFKNPDIKKIIDYYVAESRRVLRNKGISGIVVTDEKKILCADVYSSPDLFKKMFPQLMQSAAIAVCQVDNENRKFLQESDVERFLYELKHVQKVKKESPQTVRLFHRRLIGAAELVSDGNETKLIHIEAYPR